MILKILQVATIKHTAMATATAPLWSATATSNGAQTLSTANSIWLDLSCLQNAPPRTTTRTTRPQTGGFSGRGTARWRGNSFAFRMVR